MQVNDKTPDNFEHILQIFLVLFIVVFDQVNVYWDITTNHYIFLQFPTIQIEGCIAEMYSVYTCN